MKNTRSLYNSLLLFCSFRIFNPLPFSSTPSNWSRIKSMSESDRESSCISPEKESCEDPLLVTDPPAGESRTEDLVETEEEASKSSLSQDVSPRSADESVDHEPDLTSNGDRPPILPQNDSPNENAEKDSPSEARESPKEEEEAQSSSEAQEKGNESLDKDSNTEAEDKELTPKKAKKSTSNHDIVVLDPKRMSNLSDTEWFSQLSREELSWYKEHGPSASFFEYKTIQCTGCTNQILNSGADQVFRHPVLGVAICRNCKNYYENGEWSKDEEGYDVYCLWCGNGGDLILCDFCTHSFCKRCIQRNLGRRTLTEISNTDKWKCLLCHPELIYYQRSTYHAFVQFQVEKSLSKRKILKKKDANVAEPDNFLDENIGEAFKTLTIYQKCLEDERRRWIKCKKRMDLDAAGAIARNLRKIYTITKQNMDLLDADLVQSFKGHFPSASSKNLDVSSGVDNLVSQRKRKREATPTPVSSVDEFIVNGSPVTAEYHGPMGDEEFDPSTLLQVEFRETPAVTLRPSHHKPLVKSVSRNNDSDIEVLTLDSDDEPSPPPPQATKKRRPGPKSKTMYLD